MCMLSSHRLCNRLPKLGVKHVLCKAVTPDIELESKLFLVILKLTFGEHFVSGIQQEESHRQKRLAQPCNGRA